jgi:hypothetical protein
MGALMTLNKFIDKMVENNLRIYVIDEIQTNFPDEEFEQQMNIYLEGDYEIHSYYLIEKWKKIIDDEFVDDPIDYNLQGTFNELFDYTLKIGIEQLFNEDWLDDIFQRDILHTNIKLK